MTTKLLKDLIRQPSMRFKVGELYLTEGGDWVKFVRYDSGYDIYVFDFPDGRRNYVSRQLLEGYQGELIPL